MELLEGNYNGVNLAINTSFKVVLMCLSLLHACFIISEENLL